MKWQQLPDAQMLHQAESIAMSYTSLSCQHMDLVLQVEVADVISLETGNPIKYALRTQLQTDGYEVV